MFLTDMVPHKMLEISSHCHFQQWWSIATSPPWCCNWQQQQPW